MKIIRYLNQKKIILTILVMVFVQLSYSQTASQTFNTSSTFTIPTGVTQLTVNAWGGGGRGGSRVSSNGTTGGGGGGAFASGTINVIPGKTYTITVGSGSNTNSIDGGDSWFDNETVIFAKGGNTVANNSTTGALGGSASDCIGTIRRSGGNGANGASSYGGGGGSSASDVANGNNATNRYGATIANGGNGGNGRNSSSGNGSSASSPGGGGGGALRTSSGSSLGGNGGSGRIELIYAAPAEITVVGNGNSIADGDTTPSTSDWTDYGTTSLGLAVTRTYTIQNTGFATLYLSNFSLSGSDFFLTSSFPTSIAGGTSSTFNVSFMPSTTGTKTATLSFINSDSDESNFNFTIRGIGSTAGTQIINVTGNDFIIPQGSSTTITTNNTNFGATNLSTTVTRTFKIKNTGGSNLTLTGTPKVQISGTHASEFIVTVQPNTTVAAGTTTTFQITFTPTSTGSKFANVSIASNHAALSPYTFRISGVSIQAFYDTDGDGIFNNADADDDNDGIPDTVEQSNASVSSLSKNVQVTLLNETFGSGSSREQINFNVPTASTTYCYEDGLNVMNEFECDTNSDLNDGQYTVSNTAQIASWASQYWYTGPDHTADTNGRMALFNAETDITDEFYRTIIHGVTANAPLTYSFWVINLDRSNAPGIGSRNRPNITVEFRDLNNNLLTSLNTGDIAPTNHLNPTGDWYNFSASFTPTSSSISVIFRNNQPGGLGNDLGLDDILIKQILKDRDGDGIADVYDLDSDNDGIGGIVEDGWGHLSNGKDTMSLTASWVDANGNGWHDAAEAAYAASGNKALDFDGDLVPNYLDLDSDNDTRFDVDEASLFNGDGDINGDGLGDGGDSDNDGILDIFDNYVGFGNSGKSLPQNTLGSGNPDYLKLISLSTGVYDIATTLYANLDANNDGIIDETADLDKDGIRDNFDTNNNRIGSPRDLNRKLFLEFDGRNDYAEAAPVLGGLSNATLMAWVNLAPGFNSTGVVVGQNNFHLRITSSRAITASCNGTSIGYSDIDPISSSQWFHVAMTYDGINLKLFINGKQMANINKTGAINTDTTPLTIGKRPGSNTQYFKGKIDEVRLFNVALTANQLRRMVYQEIQNNNGEVRGAIIPKNIGNLPFANLLRYYRMDTYKDDIIDDITTPSIDVSTGMKMYNHKNIYAQQAPMPFITERVGDFATAVDSPSNEVRGLDVTENDYAIIRVKHDINETANHTNIGMFVDNGVTVMMNNDTKLQNDWYVKLDGKIDLTDRSQFIQTSESDLEPTSLGSLERDQQGQSNKFNYNYWSSPVSSINNSTINHGFTVAGVMKDGATPTNPRNINWVTGINNPLTSNPITLSSYWIFKFQDLTPIYANWASVGQNGLLQAGQGYTMKGSGATATSTQNYVFVGKPNNGLITSNVSATNLNLSGNPYPSALDSQKFIQDNIGVMNGTLYFWEHFSTNNTHTLAGYQGGYAARTMVGGTAPVSPAGISGLGTSTRIPGRFIPVGQGFFVTGNAIGGTIKFDNSQRLFVKEDHTSSNVLFRNTTPTTQNASNIEDYFEEDLFMKIRIGFNSYDHFHRQLLIGFMDDLATEEIDPGYDAIHIDNQQNDMYFLHNQTKLTIQGAAAFETTKTYPIGVKTFAAGEVQFTLDGTENVETAQPIYIHDMETGLYHDIREGHFSVNLPQGEIHNRFELTFQNGTLTAPDYELQNQIGIAHTLNNNLLTIKNTTSDTTVETVSLYTILGQTLATWNVENQTQNNINLPMSNVGSGTYIVRVQTSRGTISKKIIIK
ncbi:choice-of-anchor D domain-containing protein [Flavobacterium sp.]|uniref:choice-of-anchor D domain-containing protein n=1 Tax=Flavobacterium sp. TaxID=239 RepID=UPI002615EFFD|nr:choice-of-anchor D domain-containing protein [Flavobacterium sp.]MDD2986533.1 choice-of-anchor D domain-containing protein [Flavobacterium sp.]